LLVLASVVRALLYGCAVIHRNHLLLVRHLECPADGNSAVRACFAHDSEEDERDSLTESSRGGAKAYPRPDNKSFFLIFVIAALLGCLAGLAMTRLLINAIFKINAHYHGGHFRHQSVGGYNDQSCEVAENGIIRCLHRYGHDKRGLIKASQVTSPIQKIKIPDFRVFERV